jgi:uncharacterized delta-60 repeat protein
MDLLKNTSKLGPYSWLSMLALFALAVPVSSVAQVFDESFNATVGPNAGNRVESLALQPDGKILIGGAFTEVNGVTRGGLARLNPDGSLDTGFNTSFTATYVGAIAVQSDGKILVGGTLPAIAGLAATELVRLNPDGSTDLPFNPRVAGRVHDVIVLPDGDILVAGQISAVNGAIPQAPVGNLFRLNADGTRDLSLQAVVREQGFDFAQSVAIQPDGKIVVGGSFALTVNGAQSRKYLARLNADGSLNTDFPAASPFGGVQAIAVRPSGKILLGGIFDSLFDTPRQSHRGIVQLNGDGSLDTGFTPNFNVGTSVEAFALQADGKVWVGGIFSSFDGRDARRIARLMSDGSLDITFGPFPVTGFAVLAIALQPDGKPIIGGNFDGAAVGHPDIARLLPETAPTIVFDKLSLKFGAVTNGAMLLSQTSAQTVRLTQTGAGTVMWTATSNQPWLQISPASGSGSANLSISIVSVGGLPAGGMVAGAITLASVGASNAPGPINVSLTLFFNGTSANPFGNVDTPTDNRTGVTGAVPFTGWALDDIEVTRVMICRAAFGAEVAPVDPNCGGAAQIFVGFAVFIDGARPDVAAAFSTYPADTKAGWGFMVLTNMLPNQGNGTYVFYMWGQDREGHAVVLGTRTMTCANASATLPFGAIDTPTQGGVASGGSYAVFGWVLSRVARADPPGGGTVTVQVDGVAVGSPGGWAARPDLTALFAGFPGISTALGVFTLNTTAHTNGVHTIQWVVTDNLGATEGIGSRFFTVSNGAGALTAAQTDAQIAEAETAGRGTSVPRANIEALSLDSRPIPGRRGWNLEAPYRAFTPSASGRTVIRSEEVSRIELQLGPGRYAGYLRTSDGLAPLPIGSHLHATTGMFTWAPGVGFVGAYDFVFVRYVGEQAVTRQEVRIILQPKGSGSIGPQVVIDTPPSQQDVGQPFVLAGWAADLRATHGTGIATLHAWAYPLTGGAPVFLGAAAYGAVRPDVAAVHGDQFEDSGFGLQVQGLSPGHYDLAVFAWSTEVGDFVPARTVRVTVR